MTNPRVFGKNFKSILNSTFKYYFLQKQRDRLEEHVFAITFDYLFLFPINRKHVLGNSISNKNNTFSLLLEIKMY